jgi:hypothetical protein
MIVRFTTGANEQNRQVLHQRDAGADRDVRAKSRFPAKRRSPSPISKGTESNSRPRLGAALQIWPPPRDRKNAGVDQFFGSQEWSSVFTRDPHPSTAPNYYLGVAGIDRVQGQPSTPVTVTATVRTASDGSELAIVRDLSEMAGAPRFDSSKSDGLTIDKRFHFIPAANLLITVPASNDRLVLRRLSLGEAIAGSSKSIVLVTSPPVLSARRGQELTHQIQVRSSKGGITFELSAAMVCRFRAMEWWSGRYP